MPVTTAELNVPFQLSAFPKAVEGWVFAFCDFNRSTLAFVNSPPPVSIYATLQSAKQHCHSELIKPSSLKRRLVFLLSRYTVGTAIVNDSMIVPTTTAGSGPYHLEVDLLDMQTSLPLTRAWHTTLSSTKQLVVTHDLFGIVQIGFAGEVSRQLVGRKVLVVKIVLDHFKILFLLMVIMVALSIGIGFATGRVEAGLAISAIVLASVSTLHGLSVLVET